MCSPLNLNLPFIEATRRGRNTASDFTAATPPISAYRKFYAPVDPREEAPRDVSIPKGEGCSELPTRGHAFRREGEERRNKRNEQPEVSPATLRPLDPLADGSSLDQTEVPWLYCRLSLGLIVTSFA